MNMDIFDARTPVATNESQQKLDHDQHYDLDGVVTEDVKLRIQPQILFCPMVKSIKFDIFIRESSSLPGLKISP
ncbi:MAG: hypothetical protein ACOYOK_02320 [Pseudobdellovibrionaceae bacterium]